MNQVLILLFVVFHQHISQLEDNLPSQADVRTALESIVLIQNRHKLSPEALFEYSEPFLKTNNSIAISAKKLQSPQPSAFSGCYCCYEHFARKYYHSTI